MRILVFLSAISIASPLALAGPSYRPETLSTRGKGNGKSNGKGNSECSSWCSDNFPESLGFDTGKICTSLAAKSTGPCHVCGPLKPVENNLFFLCNHECLDTSADTQNCGACSNACSLNEECSNGECLCEGSSPPEYQTNTAHCGSCGNPCGAGESCEGGQCLCAGVVPLGYDTDATNCGSCGNSCGPGETCLEGSCVCSTSPSLDYSVDTTNCGSCGNACGPGETCSSGNCLCNSLELSDYTSDRENCGACGVSCGLLEECSSGVCSTATEVRARLRAIDVSGENPDIYVRANGWATSPDGGVIFTVSTAALLSGQTMTFDIVAPSIFVEQGYTLVGGKNFGYGSPAGHLTPLVKPTSDPIFSAPTFLKTPIWKVNPETLEVSAVVPDTNGIPVEALTWMYFVGLTNANLVTDPSNWEGHQWNPLPAKAVIDIVWG